MEEMRFKPGQRVKIDESFLSREQDRVASRLDPPYVATISHIEIDPHSGSSMYRFKECPWGWYDSEISEAIVKKALVKNSSSVNTTIFDIIDLD